VTYSHISLTIWGSNGDYSSHGKATPWWGLKPSHLCNGWKCWCRPVGCYFEQ
jgi:hypothetical protein